MEETKRQKYIPLDLIASHVLIWLPVKSLVRFSVVCKSWYYLIRNPDFISAHLNLNRYKSKDPCFLTVYDGTATIHSESTLIQHGEEFELPLNFVDEEIVGSCNGLMSFVIKHGTAWATFLYNPLLEKLKTVETFKGFIYCYCPAPIYGFGYNELSNDHRLVRITFLDELEEETKNFPTKEVEVYSLSTDSWHEVQGRPPIQLIDPFTTGLYVNGAVHWLIVSEEYFPDLQSIVSFDFHKEEFREILLPSELQVDKGNFADFNEFQGSIALFISEDYKYERFCLWVMNESGDSNSWNKKFTVTLPKILRRPIAMKFTKNGTVISHNCSTIGTKIFYAQFDNQQFEDSGLLLFFVDNLFNFTECLFLLDSQNVLSKYRSRSAFNWDFWNQMVYSPSFSGVYDLLAA